jgi:hypothetical protein
MADSTEKTASGCSVQLLDVYGQPFCQEPATTAFVTGCVREHLDEDRYCSRHVGLLHDGWLVCIECRRSGNQTPVSALAEVLPSGERVRVLSGTAS